MDKLSYGLGLGIGQQLKQMDIEGLNIDDFATAIKENMASQPTMIAVGCRHLLSGDGLIAILRREGYTVEPVK